MSEYLEMESSFLEANRLSVEASKLPPDKKQKFLINQEKVILKMRRLADRLKINMEDAGEAANSMAKNENKTLSSVEVQNMLKDIRKKIKKGVSTLDLKHYLSDTYGYTEHTAESYISKARKELKEYYLKDKEHFAEEFYEKYNYLYNSLVEEKQYAAAGKILDS